MLAPQSREADEDRDDAGIDGPDGHAEDDEHDVGANIPGNIVKVVAKEGDEVAKGDPIAVIEAMKMETKIIATMDGIVDKIYISQGDQVKSGQLVAKLREKEEA